ncbi:MAG: aromatic ring-hydroxylating dioxygenase subunit alpha [Candidatus Baltobacteraceae bacterium]
MTPVFRPATLPPGGRTLAARWYLDAGVAQHERERIFSRSWIAIGREEHFAEPGAYRLAEVAGESLIVVRGGDGILRALFNVCRHRGTRLCTEPAGVLGGSLQCPYHAWTYGLDGTLKVARNMEGAPDFQRVNYPLKAAAVAEWEGFAFVNLAKRPEPLASAFAPLLDRFARWRLGALRVGRRIEYDVACNWKLVFQNYSECYHCPVLHPQLERFSPWDSGRNDLDEGPFLGGYSELRDRVESLTADGRTKRAPLGDVRGDDLARIYYYTLFPTMLLSLHPDYAMAHYVRPLALDQTAIVCEWLFDARASATPGFDPSDAVEFWDLTNRQDWRISELSQAGIASRAYEPGPYAPAEGLLHAFDRHYLSVMER